MFSYWLLDFLSSKLHRQNVQSILTFYEVFPLLQSVLRIQTNEARLLFLSRFWSLLKQVLVFEVAGVVVDSGLSLKTNHHDQF